MISSCNLWAWGQVCRGGAKTLILKRTEFSAWDVIAESMAWRLLIRPVGYLVGYPAWFIVQVAWFLMDGRWAHVSTETGEFIAEGGKVKRLIPPLLYAGKVRTIDHE